MINRDKKQTDEFKKANSKTVTVGGKKKLLLMDDEDEFLSGNNETKLQEIIEDLVAEAFSRLHNKDNSKDKTYMCEGYIDEADFPPEFSIEKFKSIPSFKHRVKYAREHLERIASGSGRIVFAADKDTVIKIALNSKGRAQNEVEYDVSKIEDEIVARIKDADLDGYTYLEAERARKLKNGDWLRVTGWKFGEWMNVLSNYYIERVERRRSAFGRSLVPEDFEDIEETDLFSDVISLIVNFSMPVGDIKERSSWGVVDRDGKEKLVLVDYGLNRSVYNEFYK